MYLFSTKFWEDLRSDPREALDSLKSRKSRLWHPLVSLVVYCRIVFSEYFRNHCITRASALAFALLVTLIPLVATAAFMLASIVEVGPAQVEQFFSLLLPFAPPDVLNYISTFFVNAQKLRGWGIATLLVVAVGLFGAAEESFNTIWRVVKARTFFMRIIAFTMAIVYSPILFFLSFWLRRSDWFTRVSSHFFPIDISPFVLMVLAFTSLIWFVPNTKVKFHSALVGGLIAGALFEFERRTFGSYVNISIQTQTIYGTLAILPLFLFSLFVVSLFILFGTEAAYVLQNFRPLLRSAKLWDRRVGDYKAYLSFRMFIDAVAAFATGREPPSLSWFSKRYELTEAQALGILNWLVHADFLYATASKHGYMPARDFSKTPVFEVLETIKNQDRHIPAIPDDYAREFVSSLLNNGTAAPSAGKDPITFAELIRHIEAGEARLSKIAEAR